MIENEGDMALYRIIVEFAPLTITKEWIRAAGEWVYEKGGFRSVPPSNRDVKSREEIWESDPLRPFYYFCSHFQN